MNRQVLSFFALAASIIYGVLFTTSLADTSWYPPVGGITVALLWIAVAMLARTGRRDGRARTR